VLARILLDTTVFNYFGAMRSIDFYGLAVAHLPTPFYVSQEVFREANSIKFLIKYPQLGVDILNKVQLEGNEFRLCSTYEELLKIELDQLLDPGEAESIAQAHAIQSALFVTDDEKAYRKFQQLRHSRKGHLVSDSFQMVSSFFLLVLLEAQGLITMVDFENARNELYQIRRYNDRNEQKQQVLFSGFCADMKSAYQILGISIESKEIERKCQFL